MTKKSTRWMNFLSVTVNLDRGLSSFTCMNHFFILRLQIKIIWIVVNVTMPRQIWREYFTFLSMDMKTSFSENWTRYVVILIIYGWNSFVWPCRDNEVNTRRRSRKTISTNARGLCHLKYSWERPISVSFHRWISNSR